MQYDLIITSGVDIILLLFTNITRLITVQRPHVMGLDYHLSFICLPGFVRSHITSSHLSSSVSLFKKPGQVIF